VSDGVDLLLNTYETLVWYDGPRADVLAPVLATEVPTVSNGLISSDGLTYTLHLTPGVRFHDGTLLTADDVVYSIQRVIRIHDFSGPSWELEQVLTDYVSSYVGYTVADYLAASYHAPWIEAVFHHLHSKHIITETDVQAVAEVAVVKVDDMTVAFRLTHAYPAFVSILASPVCSILSKEYVESHGGVVNGQQNDWMNTHICGTGPYSLVSWELGVSITLTRFDGYHGTLPSLVDVTVLYVNDVYTRVSMLESGTADSIYLPSSLEYLVTGNPDISVVKGTPTFTLEFAAFNFHIDSTGLNALFGATITDDFFTDLHMRKAFSRLVDYASLIRQRGGGAVQPNGPIPMGMLGYDPTVPVYTYDLAAAQAELDQTINPATGHSWWVDGFSIPLFYNAGNVYRQAFCEVLKAGLESLGPRFTVNVVALDWPTYLSWIYSNPSMMPMMVGGWLPDYSDPDNFATTLLDSAQGYFMTFSGYANPAIDKLVREAAAELDPAVRVSLYSQVSWLTYGDVPYLWLAQPLSFQVLRSWVTGYYFNPMHSSLYFAALSKVVPIGIEVVKVQGKPALSAVSWTFQASSLGKWSLKIENNGLLKLSIQVRDVSTGMKIADPQVSFRDMGALPTGTVYTAPISTVQGHTYAVVVTPYGNVGTSAMLFEQFMPG